MAPRGHRRGWAIDHRLRRAALALSAVLAAAASAAARPTGFLCGGAAASSPRFPPSRPSTSTSLSAWSAVKGPTFLSIEGARMREQPVYRKRRGRKWRWSKTRGEWVEIFKIGYFPEPSADNSTELMVQLYKMRQMDKLLQFIPGALSSPVFGSEHVISFVRKMWLLRRNLGGRLRTPTEIEKALNENSHHFEEVTRRGVDLLETAPPETASVDLIFETIYNIAELKEVAPQFIPLVKPLTVLARNDVDDVDATKVARVIGAIVKLRDEVPELKDTLLPTLILHKSWSRWKNFWLQCQPTDHSRVLNALNKMKNEVPYLRAVLET